MADIFMSYAREDAEYAEKLAAALARAGYSVWWDRNLATGAKYIEHTERELTAARAIVVLWSKHSLGSHWVADEAASGRDNGRLVPISIDGSEPPLGFRQFQVTDFKSWKHGDGPPLPDLLASLSTLVTARAAEAAPVQRGARPIWRRPMIAGTAVAAILAVAAVLMALFSGRFAEAAAAPTLAVLPFADRNGDQRHLAAGMTDELLSGLRRVDGLSVSGGDWMGPLVESVGGDPAALGKRLSVANLLEGSVRRDGDQLRISARLTRASDGGILWAQDYDRKLDAVFDVQAEIAKAVAGALSVALDVGQESSKFGGTTDFEAYDHYLRGFALNSTRPPERPVRELEQAVAIDPNYARAWNELTFALGGMLRLATTEKERADLLARMDHASLESERLAPNMWIGPFARIWYLIAIEDWIAADAAQKRLKALPASADTRQYAATLAFPHHVGRFTEQARLVDDLAHVDPLEVAGAYTMTQNNTVLRNFPAAWVAYERSVEIRPVDPVREYSAIWLALADGKPDRASDMIRKNAAFLGPWYVELAGLLGSPEKVLAFIEPIAANPTAYTRPRLYSSAMLAGQYGRHDLAAQLLYDSFTGPGWADHFYIWYPQLHEARKSEKFKRMVTEIGLVDMWRASGDWGDFCKPVGADDFACE